MSMDKPFHVEVTVDAPRDVVWRELTEPERIRHWFGWEYDGLGDEIKFIFVDNAELSPPSRIDFGNDSVIDLVDVGDGRTLIRAVKPGDLDGVEWKDVYGGVEEGWIQFFHQLRHRLARHPDEDRRTLFLSGPSRLVDPPGEPWHSSRYQRGADVDGSLVVLCVQPSGEGMLVVSTYGLSDAEFAEAEARWTSWWDGLASG